MGICIQLSHSNRLLTRAYSDALPQLFEQRGDASGYVRLSNETHIYCNNKEEAEQLFDIAETHCKDAVFSIKKVLRLRDEAYELKVTSQWISGA